MFSKTSSVFIAAVLLFANITAIVGQESTVALDRTIKAQVNKLGAGKKVTVFMKDGTKVRGSISQILDDSFDLTVKDETQSTIVSYRDVEKVKRRGLKTSSKVIVGVALGVTAAIGVIVALVYSKSLEGITL